MAKQQRHKPSDDDRAKTTDGPGCQIMAMKPAWNIEDGRKQEQRMASTERLRSTEMIPIIEIGSNNSMMQKNGELNKERRMAGWRKTVLEYY